MSKVLKCTEFTGDNALKPDGIAKTSEPPEGFIDDTVYRYRIKPDGSKEFIGTMEAYPPGWDETIYVKKARERELKKLAKEEGLDMARKINWQELDPKILSLRKQGETIKDISLKLNLGHATVHRRLKIMEQEGKLKTETATKPEPVIECPETGEESITDSFSFTDDEPIPYILCETDMPEKETIRMIVRARFNIAEEMVMDLLDAPMALKMVKELIELGAI